MSPRVACVIPALNAAPTLGAVITGLRASIANSVIVVVDDGSADGTREIASRIADAHASFPTNRGKGAALRTGFAMALDLDADVVVTIDADGQHDPRLAPALVQALGGADLAIGARDRRSAVMPPGRRLTNRMSAAAVAHVIGRPVDDAQSGFRAIARPLIEAVQPRGDRYEFETEFLILAAQRGYRVTFVPISTVYTTTVPSHFRPLRDSARIVSTLWRFGVGGHR